MSLQSFSEEEVTHGHCSGNSKSLISFSFFFFFFLAKAICQILMRKGGAVCNFPIIKFHIGMLPFSVLF